MSSALCRLYLDAHHWRPCAHIPQRAVYPGSEPWQRMRLSIQNPALHVEYAIARAEQKKEVLQLLCDEERLLCVLQHHRLHIHADDACISGARNACLGVHGLEHAPPNISTSLLTCEVPHVEEGLHHLRSLSIVTRVSYPHIDRDVACIAHAPGDWPRWSLTSPPAHWVAPLRESAAFADSDSARGCPSSTRHRPPTASG